MDIKERVYMGKGIVIKHHVNYSTDGESSAMLKPYSTKQASKDKIITTIPTNAAAAP